MANYWWQDDPQQDDSNWWDGSGFASADTPQQHPSFFGGLAHDAGNIVKGVEHGAEDVGNFFGGIVKGVVNDAKSTAGTVKHITKAVISDYRDPRQSDANFAEFQQANKDYHEGKLTLDQLNQKYKTFQQKQAQVQANIEGTGIQDEDGLKSGAAAASTFLNAATLGLAGGAKDLAFGGVKEIGETLATQGAKAAAKQTGSILTRGAADAARKEALQEAVSKGGPEAARAALGYVGNEVGGNALLGAGFGGLQGAESDNPGHDALHGALFGGLTGALAGAGGAALNRSARAGLREVPDAATQAVSNLRGNLTPLDQSGHVRNPLYRGPEDLPNASGDLSEHPATATPLSPDDAQNEELSHNVAAGYKSADQYVDEAAKVAMNDEKGRRGGDVVHITNQTGPDTAYRTSDHSSFYSKFYADNGHKPGLQDYKAAVQDALKNGHDGGGLVYPGESRVYQILKDKQDSDAALLNEPAPVEAIQQQHLDALNGADENAQIESQAPPIKTAPADTIPTGPNNRGFLGSLGEDKTSTPEFRKAVGEVEPQTYEPRPQQPLIDAGNKLIEDNPEQVSKDILSKPSLSDQDVATGYQLTGKLSREGKVSEAVNIATHMDDSLRESGRAVKAADIVGNLTPEGVLRYAVRKIRKASEKISAGRGFEKGETGARKIADDIKRTVEKPTVTTKDDVVDAIRDAGKDTPLKVTGKAEPGPGQVNLEGDELEEGATTGQKIAKKVEQAVTPQVKKKADTLVNEISKKIKQEMLDPKVPEKKSAIDVMREVFARNKEAQEAFPEAQRILMEKAKGNPKVEAQLQKFFDAELGHPVSSSTLNNAIKEQLTKNETKIADVIYKSWNAQTKSVDDVASALVKEGFDEDSAKAVAKEVTDRLTAKVNESKVKALQRLSDTVPKKARVTFLDKVNKLSNLGALNKADYLELARTRLNLPHLSEKTASDISGLAQKMQDLPEGAERDAVARDIYKTISDSVPKTKAQLAAEVLSAPKTIMSSYDLSGTLRQGSILGSRFRTEAKDAFVKQIQYFKSQEKFDAGMSAIRHDPLHPLAERANIALTGTEGAEEAFVSQLPEKIPILGKGVQASDRAYTGALTELRFNSFKHIMSDLKEAGIDPETLSDERLKSIGKFINTASGRGYGKEGGLFEKMAPALNRTLFSPRLWKSRLDMLNPAYYAKLDPIARKYALQSAGSFAAIAATVLGLASLAGGKVETDPRSSDFLKVRFGDTRYDILSGFQQNLVFAWRELSGQRKSSTTGEVTDLTSGQYGSANRLSILSDLISNKENPVIATGSQLLKGTDDSGNKVNPATELGSLFVPLNIQDTYSVAKESDPLTALFKATVPGTLGVGVNTYPSSAASAAGQYSDFSKALSGGR